MRSLFLIWTLLISSTICVRAEVPPVPNEDAFVFDYANVLDDELEQVLERNSQALDDATGVQIVVLTIDTIGDMEPYEFGTQLIRQWGIGQAGENNGMLIYTTTEQGEGNNDVWVSVGQGLEGLFPDGKIGRYIDDYMIPYLQEGDFNTAFEYMYQNVYQDISEQYNWQNDDYESLYVEQGGIVDVIIFVVVFFIIIYFIIRSNRRGGGGGGGFYSGGYYGGSSSGGGGFGGGGGSSGGGGAGRSF